ncbi:hypothetical protein ACP70R_038426 [Stipagrostis hirtigluma subsp. patula]
MATGSATAKRLKTDTENGEDRLSVLPEELLHHILSFLPARDVVKETSLLARSWRNRWKTVPTLRIPKELGFKNAHAANKFVNYLVLLRGQNPLREFEINFWHKDQTFGYLDMWIRYALSCNVQILRIINHILSDFCPLPDMPLVSSHLTTVELCRVESDKPLLDFSTCPVLEVLKLSLSVLDATYISAPSVKHLSFSYCQFFGDQRARISAPSLISFELVEYMGMTPFLDNMPLLVSATVKNNSSCVDHCKSGFEIGDCGNSSCQGCLGIKGEERKSVLLESLSHALHLELTSDTNMFIFRSDLTLCPVFGRLKTLIVDEWCTVANLHALIYFLQHSPVLEKLTLLMREGQEDAVAKEANYKWAEQSFAFKHFTVEVKCWKISERMKRNLKILMTCGVPADQIKIHQSLEGDVCSLASLLNDEMGEPASRC